MFDRSAGNTERAEIFLRLRSAAILRVFVRFLFCFGCSAARSAERGHMGIQAAHRGLAKQEIPNDHPETR